MDVVINLLIWLHFAGLVVGMGAGFSSGQVSMRMGGAPAEARETLVTLYKALARIGHIGLGILIVTGLLVLFLKYGDLMGMGVWFWIKMALVVVLIGLISFGTRNANKAFAGDQAAIAMAPRIGMLTGMTGFLIILAAVFAFS
jgi:uncharacterized membrane protein